MTDCGFTIERIDKKFIYISACSTWSDCPHQPITEYAVTACEIVSARGPEPDRWHFIGQTKTRQEARMLEIQYPYNLDRYMTFIEPVQLCRWPVRHPEPLPE